MARFATYACIALALSGCHSSGKLPDLSKATVDPPPATLHRLSTTQYRNAISALLSPDIVVPPELEPDVVVDGFVAVGMSTATISPTGVERYESSALSIAAQAISSDARKMALFPCAPTGVSDQGCLTTFVTSFGRRAWRRPLADDEVQELVTLGLQTASTLNDPWQGLAAALAEILESPNFLFRVELGEPDPSGGGPRYGNYEMASRLAAFLTNTTPDDQLLAAADRGELVTDAGLQAQVNRLLASPAARAGMRNFFGELYGLGGLDNLNQDPTQYRAMSSDLGPSAREETLEDLEHLVFDENGDFRTFFTGRATFVNRRLAAVYDVPAPSRDGFGALTLPTSGLRMGFLGQTSFLALQAHPTSTSPVLRGKFVRQVLLCDLIPPPPAGVNTGLEPVTATVRTMRERSAEHLQEGSSCYGCHSLMDPIGLGFENFDAIGQFRTTDNGETIDASGDLDGVHFKGPTDLAAAIVASPKFPACFAKKMFEYATGTQPGFAPTPFSQALSDAFVSTGYHVKDLMSVVAMSSGFRRAGAPQ